MSYNMPGYDANNFSLGPAIVKIGALGTTPTIDLGAVEEVSFELNQEGADVEQGGPKELVEVLPSRVTAMLSFRGLEWNKNFFVWATGGGSTDGTKFYFGGRPTKQKFAVQFEHAVLGSGNTFTGRLWKCVPEGNFPITMGEAVHTFELTFRVMRSVTDWASNTIGGRDDSNSYLEVEEIAAP
jgi:hypothetical protein